MNEIEDSADKVESTSTRGSFLKRLGVTMAAAVGVAGVFASRAFADPNRCCKDCAQCGSNCDPNDSNKCYCHCDCSGIGASYCWTQPQGCTSGCVNCPC